LEFCKTLGDVTVVGNSAPFVDGLMDVVREVLLQDDVVVQVLLEVLGTLVAAMAVVDCEDLDLRPLVLLYLVFFAVRLDHIQNNCNSVFIHFSYQTNVGIGGKRLHDAELFI
jgi:hypothetical protein